MLYEIASLEPPFKALDMKGLFKKVTSGIFSDIPKKYSSDLSDVIKSLLQLTPSKRPTCGKTQFIDLSFGIEQILNMQVVKKHRQSLEDLSFCDEFLEDTKMLDTIKVPKSLQALSNRLPKPKYAQSRQLQK